uniref:Uncharacterized protein n=1 Tax=Tanacetum cinerariifolium TaxID=118510 RepID=A0A699JX98_TANCI|nr:hypothetical protein [Tanacetum cinerariifolium]
MLASRKPTILNSMNDYVAYQQELHTSKESGVDEPALGKLELDKLEVGFDLAFNVAIFVSKEEVIELDDSLYWAEVSQSLCSIDGITMSQSQTVIERIYLSNGQHVVETIKPSDGMMCQGMRKEIQTKGIIGPPRPFKDGWHNSSIVWRSGTGRSPGPSAAILELFKRVGSVRDLLRIVSSGLSKGGKRFLADERVLMRQK